jgi:MoxR-like ATPase
MTVSLEILKAAYFTPSRLGWGLPIVFVGVPGVAKSALIEAFAADWQAECLVLSPGERGDGAFGVVPVPHNGAITYPVPEEFREKNFLSDATPGVLFVDELSTAERHIQNSLLGLLGAKRIGAAQLGKRVRVFGAANPVSMTPRGYDMGPPVANRLGWIEWDMPTVEDWSTFMLKGGSLTVAPAKLSVEEEEARVLAAWPIAYAKAVGKVTAFLRAFPHHMHALSAAATTKVDLTKLTRAWSSHRSWEYATQALASADIHQLSMVARDRFVAGFIGDGVAGEFFSWLETADFPDPVEVLDGKANFAHDPERADRTMVFFATAVSLLADKKLPNRAARADRLWGIISDVEAVAGDLALLTTKNIVDSSRDLCVSKNPGVIKLLAKMLPLSTLMSNSARN